MGLELLNRKVIAESLTHEAAWALSHGADQDYLGCGLLYYAIVYAFKARLSVCLGSGGGFVPRLMRQAQRDLGIAATSRTILVDGNLPEAGWGSPAWLPADSFFRHSFPDVEIILDTTKSAARLFAEHPSERIDYLHIDADHSFAGCLDDFETYRPFLQEGSVVTLHDTNLSNAGVRHVVEHLRTLADCEVIDFPNLGEGTALLRIGKAGTDSRVQNTSLGTQESVIRVARHPDARPVAPATRNWQYLDSPAFATRYVLAAHFVKECRCVIEIGGTTSPIDHFLTGTHQQVLVLDPFVSESHSPTLNGKPCAVAHVRARFQDVDWHVPRDAEYGLVMLGMDIQGMESHHYEQLFELVNRATVTVIEFPTSWAPSREQFNRIQAGTNTQVTFQARLDLQGNDFGNLENSWPPRCDREIHVLQPK